jgi:asparagine synthase (glutamine-hydrolysing)
MCGIAGIKLLNGQKLNNDILKTFTDSLTHRGPDGSGYFLDNEENVGLGHRRLSILDLSKKASQPMPYLDRYWIIYNGEVYNFIELRQELKEKGYIFKSDSDTEVILAAFDFWGTDCLLNFNGMWALAIWDKKEKKLFLARDRFGIKPLYYLYLPNNLFAFASETKAFKNLAQFNREIDKENLRKVLQNTFSLEGYGKTIFKGINQVLPGHYLMIDKKGLTEKRWWNTLDHLVQVPSSYEEQTEKFRTIFEDACKLRMRSDVPLATALSGGLDSSAVYSTINKIMSNGKEIVRTPSDWQRAFVATFPGTSLDEKKYAQEVVSYANGQATYLTPDYNNLITKLISSITEFDCIYLTPLFVISDIYETMNKNGIKVSLDGHGVDEMMFGYPHLVSSAYELAAANGENDLAQDLRQVLLEMIPLADRIKRESAGPKKKLLLAAYNKLIPVAIKKLYRRTKSNFMESNNSDFGQLSEIDKITYDNFHYSTLPTLLRNFDLAAMRNGVEIRMPFMDWRLVTYIFSLPITSKIGGGFTKRILRDSLKGTVPENIRTRKLKIGINAPLAEWFSGELKKFIMDEMSSSDFLNSDIWDGKYLRQSTEANFASNDWTISKCSKLWPYLNALILIKNNK